MEGAVVHGGLTHEAHDDLITTAILDGESHAGGDRDMTTHDAVSTEKAEQLVEHVHRPALALRAAILPPEQFRHGRARRHAAGQRLSVITIGRDDVIVGTQQRHDTGRNGFLPDIQMAEAADPADGIHLGHALFEATLQQHRVEKLAIRGGRRAV